MAAPAITVNEKLASRVRVITVTQSGTNNGVVMFDIPEPMHSLTIQVTGTLPSGAVKLKSGNDGVSGNVQDLPTPVTLIATGIKSVAKDDLGFRHYAIDVSSSGSTNDLVATVIAKLAY
ncbi:hypothetical protein LCGC14_2918000 [marine sediment metagenome]|uniref:Uncharacterized protein n=1 Tax=marine sediment metagenome TaxID=412755 RepID=A0A0F8YBJ6_9ZZZZ